MRRLWQRMAEIYGHRWTSAYGDDAGVGAGLTWAKGLAGLSVAQIGAGLDAALVSADDWPPTLPAFRAMCFSIPTPSAVRAEIAAKNSRRSGFARLVWSCIWDEHRYRTDGAFADRMFASAYAEAREHVMRGGSLPSEAAGEIEQQPEQRTPTTPESERRHYESIAAMLRDATVEPVDGDERRTAEHRMEARGS